MKHKIGVKELIYSGFRSGIFIKHMDTGILYLIVKSTNLNRSLFCIDNNSFYTQTIDHLKSEYEILPRGTVITFTQE